MKSKAVANLSDRLAAVVGQQPQVRAAGENRATLEGGKIKLAGKEVSELSDVVILAAVQERTYYANPYTGEGAAPDCYSFDGVAPAPNAADPQHDSCASCPMNEWGSNGRGKACKERIKMAFAPSGNLDNVAILRAPVTSTANYGTFQKDSVAHGYKVPFQHATTIAASRHPKWGNVTQVQYSVGEALPDDVVMAALDRFDSAMSVLTQPYEAE